MNYTFAEGLLSFTVNTRLYSMDVLYKCLYWYTRKYHFDVSIEGNEFAKVNFSLPQADDVAASEFYFRLHSELADFKLRDIVAKETKTIRELIIAKAFANYDDDQSPATDAGDPVGFNPATV